MFKFSSIFRDDSHIHGFQTPYVVIGHKITTVPQCITFITGFYRQLRLLMEGQLTDLLFNTLFSKTTRVCDTIDAIG